MDLVWQDVEPEGPRVLPLDWGSFLAERGLPSRGGGAGVDPLEHPEWESPPGGIERDDIAGMAVFVSFEALGAARNHGGADVAAEVGGILFGRVFQDGWDTAVDIVAAVPAHGARGTAVHLVFTKEAWDRVWELRAVLAEDLEMVGWYHTHPDLGVFLSATDLRTQEQFFPHPWHVAVVLDPVRGIEGAFVGPLGREIALTPYAPTRAPEAPPAATEGPGRADSRPWFKGLGLLALVAVGLLGVVALTRRRGGRQG